MSSLPLPLWPEAERPREKLLKLGATALSEAELLAILLQTGTRGRTAVDTARGLLGEFKSLRGLLTAERRAVCRTPGLGSAKFALLQAAHIRGATVIIATHDKGMIRSIGGRVLYLNQGRLYAAGHIKKRYDRMVL